MRRPDPRSPAPNGGPMFWSRFSHCADPLTWMDHTLYQHRLSDQGDEPASSWESAWIDLGGEG